MGEQMMPLKAPEHERPHNILEAVINSIDKGESSEQTLLRVSRLANDLEADGSPDAALLLLSDVAQHVVDSQPELAQEFDDMANTLRERMKQTS